jgi:hypothetical protein
MLLRGVLIVTRSFALIAWLTSVLRMVLGGVPSAKKYRVILLLLPSLVLLSGSSSFCLASGLLVSSCLL